MAKLITITRKIQLTVINEDRQAVYKKLYNWNEQIFRAANFTSTHLYFQEKMKEFFYLTDDVKVLLSDATVPVENIRIEKVRQAVEDGALRAFNTSKANTTYRLLSEKFKGSVPSDMFSNLNNQLGLTFSKESKEYFSGKRSLRSYRRNIPMPFSAKSIRNITPAADGRNYTFDWFDGIKFKTYFGRDLSGNKSIFEKSLNGEYKLCNSSIQLDGKKIFLLACFQFETTELKADKDMFAELSLETPVVAIFGDKRMNIGDKEEFLHQRLAIQAKLRRSQIAARYTRGGRGRNYKTANIGRFTDMEKNYVTTKVHQYSRKLVDLCVKFKCGRLTLRFMPSPVMPEDLTREERAVWRKANEFLLRNWSYYGLVDKIKYKCAKVGIELIIEKENEAGCTAEN